MDTQRDVLAAASMASALVGIGLAVQDRAPIRGRFDVECLKPDGTVRWRDTIENTVVTVGKNLILDSALSGAAYTAAEFVGMISSVGYTAISAADTMASHTGWTEAGAANAPTMSGTRPAAAFAAASGGSKAFSANAAFNITGTGTLKGCFLVGGAGATNAFGAAVGVLISAGLFTGGDRAVLAADTVNVSYSMAIT